MFEIILAVVMIIAIVKMASTENLSPVLWGALAFGMTIVCLAIPFAFARILIAGVICFAWMTVYKIIARK